MIATNVGWTRWTLVVPKTNGARAYGKDVCPDAPMLASTVATVHGSPGRARYKP